MSTSIAAKASVLHQSGSHLLGAIRTIRDEVGDGLSDMEFTLLVQEMKLPVELGFAFLCYCNRCVTFSVPRQQLDDWYREQGWIIAAKERIAKEIGEKYGLTLCEPLDIKSLWPNPPNPRHHLQLCRKQESVIVIHPHYLKIRLFAVPGPAQSPPTVQKPTVFATDLLTDLSRLYQA